MTQKIVLIVEDEKDINELIRYNLRREGYQVISSYDGKQAMDILARKMVDLVILDLMLPEVDGLEICRLIRQNEKTKDIPIIMLTAKSEETDVIVGLQMGADDYVTKPFSPKILVTRVKAVLRRTSPGVKTESQVRRLGPLTIDVLRHKVSYENAAIALTTIEFNILDFLSRDPGRVFTRDQIMDSAWQDGKFIVDRAVDVHVRGLRKKLGDASAYIETIRGIGYRFKEL